MDDDFRTKWVSCIKECICSLSICLLWNGEMTDQFLPSRGIHQGDPILPYLFVLCMERLCQMIQASVFGGVQKSACLTWKGLDFSHIFFADDFVLVVEASIA